MHCHCLFLCDFLDPDMQMAKFVPARLHIMHPEGSTPHPHVSQSGISRILLSGFSCSKLRNNVVKARGLSFSIFPSHQFKQKRSLMQSHRLCTNFNFNFPCLSHMGQWTGLVVHPMALACKGNGFLKCIALVLTHHFTVHNSNNS